jgi:hypothetical protein
MELAANNQIQGKFSSSQVSAHYTGKRAFIAKCKRAITELTGAFDQLFRV